MRMLPTLLLVPTLTCLAAGLSAAAIPYRPVEIPVSTASAATVLRSRGEVVLDFSRYGTFENIGTPAFRYVVREAGALAMAAGEGVEPNSDLLTNPDYVASKRLGVFRGGEARDWWALTGADKDAKTQLYAWAEAWEDPGLRAHNMGQALYRLGDVQQAVKAWYAGIILFPQARQFSADGSYSWPVATASLGSILDALAAHPELGIRLVGARVEQRPGADGAMQIAVTPGRFEPVAAATALPVLTPPAGRKVALVNDAHGWQCFVNGKPFSIQGVSWGAIPAGVVPYESNFDGMRHDGDNDGTVDALQSWLDVNGNGKRDSDEPRSGDFHIIAGMGGNALRMYSRTWNKELLRRMHAETGIMVLVGDFFGAYCINSGADWNVGTDYTNPEQRQRMLDAVLKLVDEVKDEPWVLGYLLGNENNLPGAYNGVNATRTNAAAQPQAWASLLNEAALLIKARDPHHPVGVGNQGLGLLDAYARWAPDLDFIGVNAYLGPEGFGTTFAEVAAVYGKPVIMTEWGCPAYDGKTGEDAARQARYLAGNWRSMQANSRGRGAGNALGGIAFQLADEWWKDTQSGDPANRQSVGHPNSEEEWFGVLAIDAADPFRRIPRQGYWVLQGLWRAQ